MYLLPIASRVSIMDKHNTIILNKLVTETKSLRLNVPTVTLTGNIFV